jgi:hypothetical protein
VIRRKLVATMTHLECYVELQDEWIPEDECNSVDFEIVYGRMTLEEIRSELHRRRKRLET